VERQGWTPHEQKKKELLRDRSGKAKDEWGGRLKDAPGLYLKEERRKREREESGSKEEKGKEVLTKGIGARRRTRKMVHPRYGRVALSTGGETQSSNQGRLMR